MKLKSALITQASGSIGGLTASHNRGGLYFRARTVPTNPNSPQQQAVRAYVADLTSRWNNVLNVGQRGAWDLYATNVELPDTLGEPRNVGGIAHYVRSNVPRLQAGLDRVDNGPSIFNLGDFSPPMLSTFLAASDDFVADFNPADVWCDESGSAMLFLASRPANPTVNYFKGPYRYCGSIEGDDVTPPSAPATITAPFPFELDQRIFVQARVTRADGRLSLPFRNFGTGQ